MWQELLINRRPTCLPHSIFSFLLVVKGVKERRTSCLVAVAKHGGRAFVSKKACVYMLPVHTHTAEAARATRLSQQQLGEILPQSVADAIDRDAFQLNDWWCLCFSGVPAFVRVRLLFIYLHVRKHTLVFIRAEGSGSLPAKCTDGLLFPGADMMLQRRRSHIVCLLDKQYQRRRFKAFSTNSRKGNSI